MGILLPCNLPCGGSDGGTYVHGGALKRGTAGTLLEQGFDVYAVGFLLLHRESPGPRMAEQRPGRSPPQPR